MPFGSGVAEATVNRTCFEGGVSNSTGIARVVRAGDFKLGSEIVDWNERPMFGTARVRDFIKFSLLIKS